MSDAYDPQAPDERGPSNQYISRKDARIIGIILICIALLAWPVYMYLLKGVNNSLCAKNLRKIGSALQQYVNDNDDHLPFAYETTGFGSTEVNLHNDLAFSWQWQMNRYTGDVSVFKCPSATTEENTRISNGGQTIESSYGMLNAYSGAIFSSISNPSQKVLVSETVKSGVNGTSDPLKIIAAGTRLLDDGFVIGFDNDPDHPDASTKFATRLAFPDSLTTGFDDYTDSRHPNGIHFLSVDGSMRFRGGSAARVSLLGGGYGMWDVPQRPIPPAGSGPSIRTSPKSQVP